MSMENGFELDFPGDDDNADRFGSRAEIPGTAGVIGEIDAVIEGEIALASGEPMRTLDDVIGIGEPDAASIDEMPRVITEVENMELVLTGRSNNGPAYHYLVEANAGNRGRLYDGEDAADAMAAFTKSILDGKEYVTIEALRRAGT